MNAIIHDKDLERVKAEILKERAEDQAWLSDVFYSISKVEIDELGELLLSDTAEFGRKFRCHFDRMMKDLDSDAWDRLNQGIGQ